MRISQAGQQARGGQQFPRVKAREFLREETNIKYRDIAVLRVRWGPKVGTKVSWKVVSVALHQGHKSKEKMVVSPGKKKEGEKLRCGFTGQMNGRRDCAKGKKNVNRTFS